MLRERLQGAPLEGSDILETTKVRAVFGAAASVSGAVSHELTYALESGILPRMTMPHKLTWVLNLWSGVRRMSCLKGPSSCLSMRQGPFWGWGSAPRAMGSARLSLEN